MGMIAVKGGICAAEGFMAAATAAKIKSKRRDDMAMIFSEKPCVVALHEQRGEGGTGPLGS